MATSVNLLFGGEDDDFVTRTIHKKHAESALREARRQVAGDDLVEFAYMLAVQTRRKITDCEVAAWEMGVGDGMPADVLLAAAYLCQTSVSELIGVGAQALDRLEATMGRIEARTMRY